ncbi:MAG: hypothetical protein ACE5EV_03315, partial [Gaiellales bacterium]
MKEFFGAGGSLAAALPDFDPRDEQLELAQGVEAALLGGRHLLAEAGTGTEARIRLRRRLGDLDHRVH